MYFGLSEAIAMASTVSWKSSQGIVVVCSVCAWALLVV